MVRAIENTVGEPVDAGAGARATNASQPGPRAGRWQEFPTAPDLAVWLRDGRPVLDEVPARRVVLAGDLSGIAGADVVTFLSQGRSTGVLLVRADGVDRTLSFRNGKLCWGSSTEPSERLGEVSVRHGLLSREALERAFGSAQSDDDNATRKLGQRLVELGLLNGHEQWRALQLLVSEIFFAILLKTRGAFVFSEAPNDPSLDSHLALDTQGLLLEGVRRVDELRHFRKSLPSPLTTPRRTQTAAPLDLPALERQVLERVDGQRTLVELGMATRLGEFEATKAVHHLLELRLVAVDAQPSCELTPGPRAQDAAVIVATFNEVLTAIFSAASQAGMDAPYRISVDAFLLSEQKAQPALRGLALEGDGSLAEEKLLRGFLGADQALKRHLEGLVSFALFQAREILDPSTADALTKRARGLLQG